MKVKELIEFLEELAEEGKEDYLIIQDGYARELTRECINIDTDNQEVWL